MESDQEELRIALLRYEHLRDQLEAAYVDLHDMASGVTDEASATAFIARARTLKSRQDALMEQAADVRRLHFQTQEQR